jgi:hypothetical protein
MFIFKCDWAPLVGIESLDAQKLVQVEAKPFPINRRLDPLSS